MKLINKDNRRWFLGGALVAVLILVWWVQIYSPRREQRDELDVEYYKITQERDRLKQRREKLSDEAHTPSKTRRLSADLAASLVPGKNPEEIGAHTQLWVQEFTAGHGISVSNYRSLAPARWRDYPLCSVEFQMNASMQGLSDLLESLDRMKKAIRIERLNVDYRHSREKDLRISLELGALFVEGIEK